MAQRNLLSQSWHLVSGFKGTCWLSVLYAGGMVLFLVLVTSPFHFLGMATGIPYPTYFLMAVLTLYFTLPAFIGALLIAVKRSRGEVVNARQVFNLYQLPKMAQFFLLLLLMIAVAWLLLMIPTWIAYFITFIAMLYVIFICLFSALLIAEQGLTFCPALAKVSTVALKNAHKILGLWIILGIAGGLSVFTLGVGLIWIVPFISLLIAGIYDDCFV